VLKHSDYQDTDLRKRPLQHVVVVFFWQVMYMYYLLGYKLFGEKEGEMMNRLTDKSKQTPSHWHHIGKSAIFLDMEEDLLNQVRPTSSFAIKSHHQY